MLASTCSYICVKHLYIFFTICTYIKWLYHKHCSMSFYKRKIKWGKLLIKQEQKPVILRNKTFSFAFHFYLVFGVTFFVLAQNCHFLEYNQSVRKVKAGGGGGTGRCSKAAVENGASAGGACLRGLLCAPRRRPSGGDEGLPRGTQSGADSALLLRRQAGGGCAQGRPAASASAPRRAPCWGRAAPPTRALLFGQRPAPRQSRKSPTVLSPHSSPRLGPSAETKASGGQWPRGAGFQHAGHRPLLPWEQGLPAGSLPAPSTPCPGAG